MYVTVVPNRGSPPAILLRETYRKAGKVKNRTLANLTRWKPEKIAALRAVLRDEALQPAGNGFEIVRSLPHGHIAAALGIARRLGLDPRVKSAALMPPGAPRTRLLALALIVARLIDPAAKLATARGLDAATATHSLGTVLGLGTVAVNELYETLDWLLAQQGDIEATLARRYLGEGTLVLYDVTSTYLEGRRCPLGQFGYSRDNKPNKLQIVFVHAAGLPHRGRSVCRQHRRPEHAQGPDRQAAAALWPAPRGAGRRSRDDHPGAHYPGAATGWAGMDHRIARP